MTEQQATPEPRRISVTELKALLDAGAEVTVLDCRSPQAYESSSLKIPKAIRVPPDDPTAAANLPHDRLTVTYCT